MATYAKYENTYLHSQPHRELSKRVTPVNGQPGDVSTDYVQALRAARRNGVTMTEILHATVLSHQTTPDICWNVCSFHIPGLLDDLKFNETMCRTMGNSGLMT